MAVNSDLSHRAVQLITWCGPALETRDKCFKSRFVVPLELFFFSFMTFCLFLPGHELSKLMLFFQFVYQEQQRYNQPHKAFTFRMHGFESVVGPVKGVFDKEMSLNKAREHTLLRSDRPPYVTILSLG